MSQRSVKHLRLFGCRLDTDAGAVHWLLHYAGKYDAVEHVDIDIIAADNMTADFRARNPFQSLPLLEVFLGGADRGAMCQTKPAADFVHWPDSPGYAMSPGDRVLHLTRVGAICTFLCEHFGIADLWPRSVFQRCRVHELVTHNEVLARRTCTMIIVFILIRAHGATQEEIVTGIAAQERELLWSFRRIDEMLVAQERAAAAAAGLDYEHLLEVGRAEVQALEAEAAAVPKSPSCSIDPTIGAEGRGRQFSSPTLVALPAYIAGQSLSLVDILAASDIQILPYVQAWLPGSLQQRHFPATLRYLERMRKVDGYGIVLRPALVFLKQFRRRPKVLSRNPMLVHHTQRLKEVLAASGQSTKGIIDPSLQPPAKQNGKSANRKDRPPGQDGGGGGKGGGEPVPPAETRRYLVPHPSHLAVPPTLSESDEHALRTSQRPRCRSAHDPAGRRPRNNRSAAQRRALRPAPNAAAPTPGNPTQRWDEDVGYDHHPSARSQSAHPCSRGERTVWQHDPYLVDECASRHDPALPPPPPPPPPPLLPCSQPPPSVHPPSPAFPGPPCQRSPHLYQYHGAGGAVPSVEPLSAMAFICGSVGGPRTLDVGHFLGDH